MDFRIWIQQNHKMAKKKIIRRKNKARDKKYKVGDDVYFPTELYLSHGVDDFDGGLCKIIEIGSDSGWKWVRVKENPNSQYDLEHVLEGQKKWRKEYGKRRGKRDPDYHPDSNCWACPGDIVNGKVIDYYIP